MKTRVISTSWSLTYFWVVLSTFLGTLSTFSFVQEEWLVKRETWVVTQYHVPNQSANRSASIIHAGTRFDPPLERGSESYFQEDKELMFPGFIQVSNYSDQILQKSFNWTVIKKTQKTFTVFSMGAFGYCVGSMKSSSLCQLHGRERTTLVFNVVSLLGLLGTLTLCLSGVMSVLAVALPTPPMRYHVARTIGQAQAVSVVLLFLSVLAFPMGFGGQAVKSHCGWEAGSYNFGTCEVGWAYALLVVTASLALYCPILAHFTVVLKPPSLPKYL